MSRPAQSLLAALLGLVALAAAFGVRSLDPAPLGIVRDRVFDLYQRVDPPRIDTDMPIRMVDIDEQALALYGQWPWPRTLLAELISKLDAAGAAVIAFDMVFPEPDRSSPEQLLTGLGLDAASRRVIERELAGLPSHDERLADALAAAPTVLGLASGAQMIQTKAGFAFAGPEPNHSLPATAGVVANLPILQRAAGGAGTINVSEHDEDAVVRRIPAIVNADGILIPSLFLEALRIAQGAQSYVVRSNLDPTDPQRGIPESVRVGAVTVPLTRTGAYRVRYGTLAPDMTLSAATVLDDANAEPLADSVADTIVLIGTSAAGLFDLRASSLGELVPGVSIHAQAVAAILSDRNLSRPDWARGAELLAVAVFGLATFLLALYALPLVAGIGVALIVVSLGGASYWVFDTRFLLLDAVAPVLAVVTTFLAVTVPRLVFTDERQRFIRRAFGLYLAEPVLAQLERNPRSLALEGERRVMSILFMDVRGFTARSETMEPIEAVQLLNSLLDPLSQIVLCEDGTIDKFMGDGLMAFWNAPLDQPDHAVRAIRAGRAMVEWLDRRNRGVPEADRLSIGVGIHTGEAFVGNMGSTRRFAYSAIGDAVNLAARVETLSGSLSEPLLITSACRQHALEQGDAAHQSLSFEEAGSYSVKGRAAKVAVFRPREI